MDFGRDSLREEILDRIEDGFSPEEVAEMFDLNYDYVYDTIYEK